MEIKLLGFRAFQCIIPGRSVIHGMNFSFRYVRVCVCVCMCVYVCKHREREEAHCLSDTFICLKRSLALAWAYPAQNDPPPKPGPLHGVPHRVQAEAHPHPTSLSCVSLTPRDFTSQTPPGLPASLLSGGHAGAPHRLVSLSGEAQIMVGQSRAF